MKLSAPFVLALTVSLTACGGSGDDGFQFPGATGAALPYALMSRVDNTEKTELRNGS
jgi:predicted small lipoprotein YifL